MSGFNALYSSRKLQKYRDEKNDHIRAKCFLRGTEIIKYEFIVLKMQRCAIMRISYRNIMLYYSSDIEKFW